MKPLRAAFAELQISQNRDWDAERRDGGLRPDCAVNWDEKSGKVPVTYLAGWCPLMTSGGPAWSRASVMKAFHRARQLQHEKGFVSGPKELGTFGASYIYPVFLRIGVCSKKI